MMHQLVFCFLLLFYGSSQGDDRRSRELQWCVCYIFCQAFISPLARISLN